MSILTINLKQLYQRRGLWLAYALFALFVWVSIGVPLDEPVAGRGKFIGLICMAFLIGMAAAVLQLEILTKPMVFCLPRHRRTVREFIFSIGLAANGVGALLFLFYPGLPFVWRLLVLGSAFAAGLVFYLAGAMLVFRWRQANIFVGLLALALFGGGLLRLNILLERVVVGFPLLAIGFALLVAAGAWVYLNDPKLARRNCLQPWVGFDEMFNREKLRRSQHQRGALPWDRLKDHPRPWVEAFFLGRMTRSGPFSTARSAWGALYGSYAVLLSQWTQVLLLAPFLAVILGYLGPRMWSMLAMLPVIAVQTYAVQPAVYSTMLTAGGRRQRFGATLAMVLAGTGLLLLFVAVVSLVSIPLSLVLPDIRYEGFVARYRVIGVEAFYMPLVFLPLASAVQLLFYRRPGLMIVVLMFLAYPVLVMGMFWREELTEFGCGAVVLVTALCWLAYAGILWYVAHRRCLVR